MANAPGALSAFLAANRAQFLEDVAKDGAKNWTVVMGNEAGDLDSVASAIAYSFLARKNPHIGLIQTPRPDLRLRNENLFAFDTAKISASRDELLCIDDLPVKPSELQSTYALVDHNKLLPLWQRPQDSPNPAQVVGIIDHHDDEHEHKNADPRLIVTPIGSCASLVAKHFESSWTSEPADPSLKPPPELATFLLSAIYIDTGGLKAGGKGKPTDVDSAAFLAPYSSLSADSGGIGPQAEHGGITKQALNELLSTHKSDVDSLNTRDLLRRDYKQYTFTTPGGDKVEVGLSTVPIGLKAWLIKDPDEFRKTTEAWATERGLDVAGVCTTFRSENKHKKRRELFLLIGADTAKASTRPADYYQKLEDQLVEGLEAVTELELEKEKIKGDYAEIKGDKDVAKGSPLLWRLNPDATRKVVGPAFKLVLEGKPVAIPEPEPEAESTAA